MPLAQQVWADWQACSHLPQALNAQPNAAGVRFVPQADLPEGVAYEQFIFDTHQVPTRNNLHDFYNGLMWLHFPQTKRRLNVLQAQELARMQGVHATRGPLRDALTLFDENVLLLQAPDALWQALAYKQWEQVFGTLRALWDQSRMVQFGHATLEQLVHPFKGITAHVFRVPCGVQDWDSWLAQALQPALLEQKPYVHLPVLGIPDWWAPNSAAEFYHDTQVFRPLRKAPPDVVLASAS